MLHVPVCCYNNSKNDGDEERDELHKVEAQCTTAILFGVLHDMVIEMNI